MSRLRGRGPGPGVNPALAAALLGGGMPGLMSQGQMQQPPRDLAELNVELNLAFLDGDNLALTAPQTIADDPDAFAVAIRGFADEVIEMVRKRFKQRFSRRGEPQVLVPKPEPVGE